MFQVGIISILGHQKLVWYIRTELLILILNNNGNKMHLCGGFQIVGKGKWVLEQKPEVNIFENFRDCY